MNEYEYTFGHTDVSNTINRCRANENGLYFDPRYADALPQDHSFNVTLYDFQKWNGVVDTKTKSLFFR